MAIISGRLFSRWRVRSCQAKSAGRRLFLHCPGLLSQHTTAYFASQRNILAEADYQNLVAQQRTTLMTRLQALHGRLNMRDAEAISQNIAAGPWNAAQGVELAAALNEAIQNLQSSPLILCTIVFRKQL